MEFQVEAKKQSEKSLKEILSDREREYLDTQFKDYLLENMILSQLMAPRTPEQNCIVEKRNHMLLDMLGPCVATPHYYYLFRDMRYKQKMTF